MESWLTKMHLVRIPTNTFFCSADFAPSPAAASVAGIRHIRHSRLAVFAVVGAITIDRETHRCGETATVLVAILSLAVNQPCQHFSNQRGAPLKTDH
jgi:hypothetical protein